MKLNGIQKSQGFVVTNNNPSQIGFPCPDVNAVYGPYRSLESAYQGCLNVFGSSTAIPMGVTVGVINGNKIKEYWFEEDSGGTGYNRKDLKVKGAEIDGVMKTVTLSESAWAKIEEDAQQLQDFCSKYDGWSLDVVQDYVEPGWHFGDKFPVVFSGTIWAFGDSYPIKLT